MKNLKKTYCVICLFLLALMWAAPVMADDIFEKEVEMEAIK